MTQSPAAPRYVLAGEFGRITVGSRVAAEFTVWSAVDAGEDRAMVATVKGEIVINPVWWPHAQSGASLMADLWTGARIWRGRAQVIAETPLTLRLEEVEVV